MLFTVSDKSEPHAVAGHLRLARRFGPWGFQRRGKHVTVEILLQLRSGERRAIVQAKAGENFNPGDAVILVTTGGRTRVTRAPASTQAVQPLPAPVQSAPRG